MRFLAVGLALSLSKCEAGPRTPPNANSALEPAQQAFQIIAFAFGAGTLAQAADQLV